MTKLSESLFNAKELECASSNDELLREIHRFDWGNAKPPAPEEMSWILSFGKYPDFDPAAAAISKRLSLTIANLKEATRLIVYYHYLHRGRTMAQLPYWICIDGVPVGVILYAYPRLSVPLFGIQPMNVLELARIWLSPDVQGGQVMDSKGEAHSPSVVGCAIAQSLRRIQRDWYSKYPKLPDVLGIVSWADDVHHEGTIYKACNFQASGKSGGSLHGNRQRPNGGRDKLNPDYEHSKTRYWYPFKNALSASTKRQISNSAPTHTQLSLLP
jgi:hypothetical protein